MTCQSGFVPTPSSSGHHAHRSRPSPPPPLPPPRQLVACSSAMIPISRLKIINLRDRHIASEQRVMVKKRKYIKSGKFSKKNKGLVTESCQQYGPIWGKNVFKVSVLKLTIEMRRRKLLRCPHGRQRSKCKDCGGKGVCTHGKQRSCCKDCGGKAVCTHGRLRSRCKDCGGTAVCTHGRLRYRCKDCGGGGICEHGRRRGRCNECLGGNNGVSRKSGKSRSNPPGHVIDNMQVIKKEVSER